MTVRELFDLTGTTALVTGGSGMYGFPVSEALAEAGAHVVIASRSLDACQRAADALCNAGYTASAEQYDQASEESILALRDRLLSHFGRIETLVNNSVADRCAVMKTIWIPGVSRWRSTPPGCSPSAVPFSM